MRLRIEIGESLLCIQKFSTPKFIRGVVANGESHGASGILLLAYLREWQPELQSVMGILFLRA